MVGGFSLPKRRAQHFLSQRRLVALHSPTQLLLVFTSYNVCRGSYLQPTVNRSVLVIPQWTNTSPPTPTEAAAHAHCSYCHNLLQKPIEATRCSLTSSRGEKRNFARRTAVTESPHNALMDEMYMFWSMAWNTDTFHALFGRFLRSLERHQFIRHGSWLLSISRTLRMIANTGGSRSVCIASTRKGTP